MNSAPKGRRGRKGRKGASGRLGAVQGPRGIVLFGVTAGPQPPRRVLRLRLRRRRRVLRLCLRLRRRRRRRRFGRALQGSQTGTSTCLSPPATQSFQTIFAMKRSSPKYCLLPSFTRATFFCFTFLLGSYWSTLCTAQFWFLGFGRGFGGCFLSLESCWWGYICCCHIQYI